MAFKFDKLWDVLQERGISKEQLRVGIKASQTTIVKMGANGNVSLEVIDKICNYLGCSANEIMEHVLDEEPVFKMRGQMKKGSVYLCATPHEVNGEKVCRPVLVLQASYLCTGALTIMTAPFVSRTKIAPPFCVPVVPTKDNGLRNKESGIEPPGCFLAFSQVRYTPLVLLSKKIGELEPEQMAEVDKALKTVFDLH